MQNQEYRIKNREVKFPCKEDWNRMDFTEKDSSRFCKICSKCVHDLTQLNKKEIFHLLETNNDVCVRKPKEKKWRFNNFEIFKRYGKMSLIAFGLLGSIEGFSQKNELNEFSFSQVETKSNMIVISGKISVKKLFNKKIEDISINIHSGKTGHFLDSFQPDKRGIFVIEIDKETLGNNFTVSFHHEEFKSIKIKDMVTKNTTIEINFRQKGKYHFVTGRYF